MKPAAFKYWRARNADEAIALAAAAGDEVRFLAGGQSLVPMMNFRIARPSTIVDLGECSDLAIVRPDDRSIRIGAMVRQRDAASDALLREHCPLVCEALEHAGPLTVRNRATVGGSVANAYPLAQLTCALIALDASVVLHSPTRRRTLPVADFLIDAMVTAIEPGELLQEIIVPCRARGERQAFREAGNHAGGAALAIACGTVSSASDGSITDARIAVSGVAGRPLRLAAVELAVKENADADRLRAAFLRDVHVDSTNDATLDDAQSLAVVVISDLVDALCSSAHE